ncbi:GNAT family N-acetyltransferase [Oceanobacillus luteolus]|uniref:GNAT family N-acetyltransferase n=1 Tax=Oceanobacillus luteolus TaxID=1274358 RepID=A0ABW4HSZ8_9BACI
MRKAIRRAYTNSNDLLRMQELTRALWTLDANYHIGDLAWQRNRHVGLEENWITAIWEVNGKTVAWGWIELPDNLIFQVDPNFYEVAMDVLDWFDENIETNEKKVSVLDKETHLISTLQDALYTPLKEAPYILSKISLDRCPFTVQLPDKFIGRHLQGPKDIQNRVTVHKAAFHPSKVSEESYLNVMNAFPYDPSLDWVIESPNGEFVAFCLIWYDEENKVGLLEPVGTDPRFRRMGLASSVCKLALNELRKKGAETAIVCTWIERPGKPHPDSLYLYKSIGFEQYAETKSFHRSK